MRVHIVDAKIFYNRYHGEATCKPHAEKIISQASCFPAHSTSLPEKMTAETNRAPAPPERTTCPSCGGSGHLGLFRGESRFMISWEECDECNGTGHIEPDEDSGSPESSEAPPQP